MATSNNRDVRLGIEIQTAGEEDLGRLAKEVRALAKAGGDAAPEFAVLADRIEGLAAEAKALSAYKQAAQALEQTATAARVAGTESDRLKTAFAEQAAVAEAARAKQASLAAELDRTQRSISEQVRQQALLKTQMKGASDDTGAYAQAARELSAGLANLKKQASDLQADLKQQSRVTSDAASALERLRTSSLTASSAAATLQSSLREQGAAMETARSAGEKLGADFADVAVAQERLQASLRDTGAAVQAAAAAKRLAEEERALAAAVQALDDDLEKQAATVRGKLISSLNDAAAAYERDQAALRESIVLAERSAAAKAEQAEADRLAALAARGLAEAQERGRVAAQSELTAIAESEAFMRRYAQAKQDAAANALEFVLALEREEEAARRAAAEMDALGAAARKREADAKYVRELAAALDAVDKEAAAAAAQVQRLQGYFDKLAQQRDVIGNAFSTAGVRSIQAIEQEMFKVNQALVTLRGEFANGRISVTDFDRAVAGAKVRLEALKTEIATIPGSKSVFMELAEGANNLITKFGALTAALATVGFALKPLVDSFVKLESTTRILTNVTGSAAEAAKQIEFLRNVAQQSGQSFDAISQSYAKFAASALQAGLSTDKVQAAFRAVSLAAGNLGLSSEQAQRALEALSQMASKGVVSMEELRQQLGDALPGILPALAKQLGLTTSELSKMVESGQLLAVDAIPAITAALQSMGGQGKQVEGLVASWNRFINVMKEAGTTLLDGPLGKAGGAVLIALETTLRGLAITAVAASEAFTVMGKTVGLALATLSGGVGSARQFLDEFNAAVLESADRYVEFRDRANGAAAAAEASGQKAAAAAPQVQQFGAANQSAGQAAAAAAGQHAQAGAAATASGQAASSASTLLYQLAAAYNANVAAAEDAVRIATKATQARKEEGDAAKALAELTGQDTTAKLVAADAAVRSAEAARAEAAAKQTVVDVLRAQREATERQAVAEGKLDEERKKLLAGMDDQIAKKQADADASRAAAQAATAQAVAVQQQADVLRDNSGRLAEYAEQLRAAKDTLVLYQTALEKGQISQEGYSAAVTALARATGLYRDALADAAKIGIDVSQIQTGISDSFFKTVGSINGVITSLKDMGVAAEQAGPQLAAALDKQIQAAKTRQELEFVRAEVLRARDAFLLLGGDAEAALEKIRRKTEALSPALRQAQEDAKRLGITLKDNVGGGADAGVEAGLRAYERLKAGGKASEAELSQAFRNLASEAIKSANGQIPEWVKVEAAIRGVSLETAKVGQNAVSAAAQVSQATAQMAVSLGSVQSSADKLGESLSVLKTARTDAQGFVLGPDGNRLTTGKQLDIPDGYYFDAAAANRDPRFQRAQTDGREFIKPTAETLAKQAAEDAAFRSRIGAEVALNGNYGGRGIPMLGAGSIGAGGVMRSMPTSGGSALGIPSEAVPVKTPASTSRTVNINIAGLGAAAVNVASDADAAKLEALLRSLGNAANRSAA